MEPGQPYGYRADGPNDPPVGAVSQFAKANERRQSVKLGYRLMGTE